MLYDIVTEQVSQKMVFHELLMNSKVHVSSVILYVRCSFSLVLSFSFAKRKTGRTASQLPRELRLVKNVSCIIHYLLDILAIQAPTMVQT
jgi:hypothetical protein